MLRKKYDAWYNDARINTGLVITEMATQYKHQTPEELNNIKSYAICFIFFQDKCKLFYK